MEDIREEGNSSSEDEEDIDLRALETLPNGRKDVKHAAVNMVVDMRGVAAMTRVGVRRAMNAADIVLKVNNLSLKSDVEQYLIRTNQINTPQGANLLSKFDKQSPFKGIKSNEGQISGIKKYYSYIQPETCHLEEHLDLRLEDNGAYGLVPVPGTYESVSIIEILKLVARKTDIMNFVNNLNPSEDGTLSSYTDGDQYRRSEFFQRYPHAFQLCLYEDGVDPCDAQGPKSGLHELGNFLLTILNVPQWINSSLAGIHPVVVANALDCKGTFDNVLHKFMQELRQLEGPGVRAFINGEFVTLRATLVAVKADSKAAHELLGFVGCGARHFCRQCMISRPELHRGTVQLGIRRTPELSEMQLERVAQNAAYSTECGLRYRTCLHDSLYFRAENNCNFDLMHDGPEGIIIMLIRLCLRQFIVVENLFTVEELNRRIFAFNYGRQNMKDKPTPNFTLRSLQQAARVHKQKMNAGQIMVLFRSLPFLLDNIGDNGGIPEDHEHLQVLLLVLQIFKFGGAPVIPRNAVPMLRRQLDLFWRCWYIMFPDVDPINKFHHLMHLADNIEEMGPQRQYACYREEGKNCPVKRHVATCNNFKNPQKTALQQQQIFQAKIWGTQSPNIELEIKYIGKKLVSVGTLPVARQLEVLGFVGDDQVRCVKAVQVKGFEYRIGEFVVYARGSQNIDDLPSFGRIESVICPEDTNHVWLGVQHWHTEGLVECFNSYSVSLLDTAPTHLIDVNDLPLHPPISAWQDYSSDRTYLCLKHLVF